VLDSVQKVLFSATSAKIETQNSAGAIKETFEKLNPQDMKKETLQDFYLKEYFQKYNNVKGNR